MRQYDVCAVRGEPDNLVIVLQHDVADDLATRIVAPLSGQPYRQLIKRIRVPVDFQGRQLVIHLDRMAAIERASLGKPLGNAASEEYRIKNALDLLFLGV